MAQSVTGSQARLSDFARRSALLALCWLGLNGGDHASWIVGAPLVMVAAALSVSLRAPSAPRMRWAGLPPFVAYFLSRSVLGAWDVARRTLRPRLAITPGFVCFETMLPPGAPRVLFAGTVSLLPGTLVAGVDERRLEVHALDTTGDLTGELRRLERRVAALFRAQAAAGGDSTC